MSGKAPATDGRRRPLASSEEVAAYLNVPVKTLGQWAYRGVGPQFSRVGKYRRYRWVDVEKWVADRAQAGAPV